jgi:hypothetical protein
VSSAKVLFHFKIYTLILTLYVFYIKKCSTKNQGQVQEQELNKMQRQDAAHYVIRMVPLQCAAVFLEI